MGKHAPLANMDVDISDSVTPYRELWQSVVYQSVVDATAPNPSGSESIQAKRDAHSWINGCGKDFRDVCMRAGLDPDFISDAYKAGRINRDLLKADRRRVM